MKQLILARSVVDFQDQAERWWSHSLRSASAAYLLAKRLPRISPEEALLAGGSFEWLDIPNDREAAEKEELEALKQQLGEEIDAHEASLKAALS